MARKPFLITAALGLCLSATTHAARAPQPKTPRAPQPTRTPRVQAARAPITELRERLLRPSKDPSAHALAKALQLLDQGKWLDASRQARKLQSDVTFSDYGFWIEGQAQLHQASAALEHKQIDLAILMSRKAREVLTRTSERQPYSPLHRKASMAIAQAELTLAEVYARTRNWAALTQSYESAFQRIQAIPGALGMLDPSHLERYFDACRKKPSPLCEAWSFRLQSAWPRSAPESKLIAQALTDVERPRPPSFTRATQSYRMPDADQVAFTGALEQMLQGKTREAIVSLQRFLDEFPRSTHRHRARYWLGQALLQRGEKDKAAHALDQVRTDAPLTWYGLLASQSRAQDIRSYLQAGVPEGEVFDAWLNPSERVHLDRAQRLLNVRRPLEAADELKDLKARDAFSNAFVLYLALLHHEAGSHLGAFNLVAELIQRGAEQGRSAWILELIFPLDQWKLARKVAEQEQVDPLLVLSLMKQESAFDPSALSGSGANGLMQLMYATALDTEPTIRRAKLLNPEDNVRVGTRYLKQLLTRFNGNVPLALAGYNAGPAAASRFLRDFRGKGMIEFIEAIPYRETREYVGAILRNYYWYSGRVGQAPVQELERFWTPPVPAVPQGAAPAALPAGSEAPETATDSSDDD